MKFTDHHHEQLLRAAAEVWPSRAVHPGDSGTRNLADAEAIRAHNAKWSPTEVWHYDPIFAGANNGETGV